MSHNLFVGGNCWWLLRIIRVCSEDWGDCNLLNEDNSEVCHINPRTFPFIRTGYSMHIVWEDNILQNSFKLEVSSLKPCSYFRYLIESNILNPFVAIIFNSLHHICPRSRYHLKHHDVHGVAHPQVSTHPCVSVYQIVKIIPIFRLHIWFSSPALSTTSSVLPPLKSWSPKVI